LGVMRELTIMTRQKTRRPVALMTGLADTRVLLKVARMMMPSSMPYILRRPKALVAVSIVTLIAHHGDWCLGQDSLRQPSEENHSNHDAGARRSFEGLVDRAGQITIVSAKAIRRIFTAPEDQTEESCNEVDGEDVV
jgi:hypothetical protein